MYILDAVGTYQIDQPPNTYIYDIVPTAGGLAVISSDDNLRLVDPLSLHGLPLSTVENVHQDVTCLKALDAHNSIVCTAGRDGLVNIFDFRSQSKVSEVRTDQGVAVLSLSTSSPAYAVAAGTELANYQAAVLIWDTRNLKTPQVQYIESHSDDVTELQHHPSNGSILLSGSVDGLVNLYDSAISVEEDALHQTINHGSSVHHAGFLNEVDIFALSHDEKFSVYKMVTNLEETVEEPPPCDFGDLRETLGCEYVANVLSRPGGGAVAGVGTHSEEAFAVVQLRKDPPWTFVPADKVLLADGHGSEIVRSFCFIDNHRMILTAGEDGKVIAWKADS